VVSRILSTLLLWAVVLASLWYFGAHAAVWLLTIIATLSLHEFYDLTEKMGCRPFRWLGLVFCVAIIAAPYYVTEYVADGEEFAGLAPGLLAIATVVFAILSLGAGDNLGRINALASTLLGLVYVPFTLHYLVRILLLTTDPTAGMLQCVWVVAVSKFCDVGALLTGLAFGRHKLAPAISPKKTWEGAVGGVLVSAGVGAAYAYYAADYLPDQMTPLVAALVALPLAITTIVSDLVESAIKRRADIKDTGAIIPGIGGALDLSDSLMLTAPVAYFIFLFLT